MKGIDKMRMRLLIVGLALAGMQAAQASDLVITSFDATGRLMFQELPAATSYRVEWATNLISPTWSSSAPGPPPPRPFSKPY